MAVNLQDERLLKVEADRQAAIAESDKVFNDAVAGADEKYASLIDATKGMTETINKNQQEQADFAIDQVNQQKEQNKKDYTREQAGAYADYQKQVNPYGANAEAMAAQGLSGTGYSESSKISMYNAYQNRIAIARESFDRAVQSYDNAITEARLQNNAALAENAYNALQQEIQLSLEGWQYTNTLNMNRLSAKQALDSEYNARITNTLSQINSENSLEEQRRQFDSSLAEERRQFDASLSSQAVSSAYGTTAGITKAEDDGYGGYGSSLSSSAKGLYDILPNNVSLLTEEQIAQTLASSKLGFGGTVGGKVKEVLGWVLKQAKDNPNGYKRDGKTYRISEADVAVLKALYGLE